jgi:ADP-ribosylglycohydrolase
VNADRLRGTLLGTALGDALGLPAEGMSAKAIARRFGRVEDYHLLGSRGFVSDDTEQSALVAHALLRSDLPAAVRSFRRSLLGWFLRLPWGIGLATVRACLRIALGLRRSGVRSAGNGASMRAAIVGVFFAEDPARRREWSDAIASVTHVDPRAVQGARFVAEVAAAATRTTDALACVTAARPVVDDPQLGSAIDEAIRLVARGASTAEAAAELGTTGFVLHTVPFAVFCFGRFGGDTLRALSEQISAGGDTDSIGAIVGAWCGALHGESGLPRALIDRISDGPFGPSHLRALGDALAARSRGEQIRPVSYSASLAMLRNLALYPVVLAHGFRRLIPL